MFYKKEAIMYEIICVSGHYEGYYNGSFLVSGDTHGEVERELDKIKQ